MGAFSLHCVLFRQSRPSELYSDEVLESLGYIVNTRGRFLICTGCFKPVLPCLASGHAHENYNREPFNPEVLEAYIYKYRLFEKETEFDAVFFSSLAPQLAFEGLEIKSAFGCSLCLHARSTVKSLQNHWRDRHAGIPFQRPDSEEPVQYIYLSPQYRRLLPVIPALSTPDADDLMEACLAAYDHLPKNLDPAGADVNAREPPPWLRMLGWLKWVSGYKPCAIAGFVQSVKKEDLFGLVSDALTGYLERAMRILVDMPSQIRQTLRSITQ